MKFKLLKILLIALCIELLPAQATGIKVDTFSMPIKTANRIFQPLNILVSSDGAWKLFIESLGNQIRNQDNPNYFIPLTRLELTASGGSPIAQFSAGKIIEVNNSSVMGLNNLNLALNLLSLDCDRAGHYLLDIKFTLVDGNSGTSECVYTFQFDKDEVSAIDFSQRNLKLSLDKNKILRKNSSQNLGTPLSVYVSSNKNWKLYIRKTTDENNKGVHTLVKVLGGDNSINCITTNEYIPMTNNPILLASGKATINQNTNSLERKLINIDYLVKGPENNFIPAGSVTEAFEYRLQTED